jgi:DNA polymerase III subunit epsilon
MLREIVLDTETTGTEALKGDRIVEIGCVELLNHCPTGKTFHTYLNPQRAMSDGAFRVHGLSDGFLADKPLFAAVASDFLNFIGDADLVIHNAPFDIGFLNMELAKIALPALKQERVIDTLIMARRKHTGASNSLDALCQRYNINNSGRVRHGALLDAELLAEVYIELIGGRQTHLGLDASVLNGAGSARSMAMRPTGDLPVRQRVLPSRLNAATISAHAAFITKIGEVALWNKHPDYFVIEESAATRIDLPSQD